METTQVVLKSVSVSEHNFVTAIYATRIFNAGLQVRASERNVTYYPGDALIGEDAKIVSIANAVWTPGIIAAYRAEQERIAAEMAAAQQL